MRRAQTTSSARGKIAPSPQSPSIGTTLQSPSYPAGQTAPALPSFFEYVVVCAGEQRFAVDAQAAVEIRGPERFDRPIPRDGPALSVRGDRLRVADLRRLSGLPAFAYDCPAMLLVKAGADVIGLAVDEVGEIESVPRERLRAANPLGYVFCSHSIALGADGEIPLIDPALLIAS
ncbi:chemotaxis protein CheW [Stenotrophomonas sp. NPDC077659]|uniref:chemotaxis protein CheW n=1 Tax=Stenotrophomonas sp. NPDC077659 TaxID=3390694 RepID=UPI003D080274